MTYLAIDWGKKRIGLAVGTMFPKGAGVIDGEQPQLKIIDEIERVIKENEVEKIVIGLPTLPSGDEGNLASEVRDFAKVVADQTGLEVCFEPEDFTSLEASSQFREHNKKVTRKSGKVDEMAAILILEQFISHEA